MVTVKNRQKYLKTLGFYNGEIDGKEGSKTKAAYKALQKKYFTRSSDIDGVYGTNTNKLLLNAIRVHNRTENFKLEEFRCNCGAKYCTGYPNYLQITLLENLQKLRDKYKKPITITSGLRCKKYNASLSGSISTSRHMTGEALDLYISGKSDTTAGRKEIIKVWMQYPKANYAYQGTAGMGNATHVDIDEK